jgi:hypothetical protein
MQERGEWAPGALDGVASRLRERAEGLADEIIEEIRTRVPGYESVSRASLRHSLLQHVETAATALTAGRVPERIGDVSVAAERARSGIRIEHVLLAIRVSFQCLREFAIETATDLEIATSTQLEAVRVLWEVNDLVSREYAVAHREEDLEMARTAESHRVEILRRLLTQGPLSPETTVLAGSLGLVAGVRYRAFRARPVEGGAASSLLQEIVRWAAAHHLDAVGAVVEGDAAGVLAGTGAIPAAGPTVGVGPAVDLRHVHESYRVASRITEVAAQFGRCGPETLHQLSLRVAVAAEHDIGDVLVERILAPLLEQGEFGLELIASLDAFLASGMNTAVAARALVVHPNTLRYRINQVKKLSGITLQSVQETSEVWWALHRHEWARRTGYRS